MVRCNVDSTTKPSLLLLKPTDSRTHAHVLLLATLQAAGVTKFNFYKDLELPAAFGPPLFY